MRTGAPIPLVTRTALVLATIACFAAAGASQTGSAVGLPSPTAYTVRLDALSVVPSPARASRIAGGGVVVRLVGFGGAPGGPALLVYDFSWPALTTPPVAAHVHLGGRGTVGHPVLDLCGDRPSVDDWQRWGPVPSCGDVAYRGEIVIPSGILGWMRQAGAYIDVHTTSHQAGELRGQIPAKAVRGAR